MAIDLFDDVIRRFDGNTHHMASMPNLKTFELLLEGCHIKAMPEKALEILTVMLDLGLDPSEASIQHTVQSLSIAHIWDKKIHRAIVKVKQKRLFAQLCD